MVNPRVRMYFRSITMPLLLVAFIITGFSAFAMGWSRSETFSFLALGVSGRTWAELHSTCGFITIGLAVLHVLFEFKTLVWSIKFVFSRPAKPKS